MTKAIVLLDACIAINIACTGRSIALAEVLDVKYVMARPAAAEIGDLEIVNGTERVCRADGAVGQPFMATVVSLAESEIETYVSLASDIDDGEAATLAVAVNRKLLVATDDKKARRVAVSLGLPAPLQTTHLLREFCDKAQLSVSESAEMLRRVRDNARYIPRMDDPHIGWWRGALSRSD